MSIHKIVQDFNDVTQIDLGVAHIAALPTGERVELPAGTVLREAPLCPRCNGTGSIETGNNDLPCDCPAGARAWFNVATKGGSRPKQGAEILADLTERVGLPREMAPSNTVREEDDMGVRFVDRSQAMIDRNKRARETWDLAHIRTGLPVPPMGSGCRVYSCWTPCAPEHHYCALHGGADAVPPTKLAPRT